MKQACQLLANCTLLGGLNADERAAVAALARIRTFNAGETVFAIGCPGDQMMALLSGSIRISVQVVIKGGYSSTCIAEPPNSRSPAGTNVPAGTLALVRSPLALRC